MIYTKYILSVFIPWSCKKKEFKRYDKKFAYQNEKNRVFQPRKERNY